MLYMCLLCSSTGWYKILQWSCNIAIIYLKAACSSNKLKPQNHALSTLQLQSHNTDTVGKLLINQSFDMQTEMTA